MDKLTEHRQWEICPNCGEQMVPHPRYPEQGGGGYPWLVCPKDVDYCKFAGKIDDVDRPRKQCLPPPLMAGPFVHGAYYRGKCRNAHIARWNQETQLFVYMREKFGHVFPEDIGYWVEAQPGEHRFDEFRPYARMENPPFEIPLTAR